MTCVGTRQDFFIVIEKYGLEENDLSINDVLQINASIFYCCYCGLWLDNSKKSEKEDEIDSVKTVLRPR